MTLSAVLVGSTAGEEKRKAPRGTTVVAAGKVGEGCAVWGSCSVRVLKTRKALVED